ncbi:MAG: hypothetical protein SVY53_01065 [Chloroflexota bacterium]|nr:hypothetical protein [Chloroflexota bacterium]
MGKKLLMKSLVILALPIIFVALLVSGCGLSTALVPLSTNVSELSLVEVWDEVLGVTDMQNSSARLEHLIIHTDRDGMIENFSLSFYAMDSYGQARLCVAERQYRGDLRCSTTNIESLPQGIFTLQPHLLFQELDNLDLVDLEPGDGGLHIKIDSLAGSVGYDVDYTNVFVIENGELRPIRNIVFRSAEPWTEIWISQSSLSQEGDESVVETAPGPVPPEERQSQIWFSSYDMHKADVIEYL